VTVASLDPSLQHLLHVWMPRQRWYPAKGRGVGIRRLGGVRLEDVPGEVRVEVLIIGLDSGDRVDVVQVPLTYRASPLPGAEDALVGEATGSELGRRWIYDGTHDPAYVAALLDALHLAPGADRPDAGAGSKVLSGEQSNTSIIVGGGSDRPSIVKLFRTLHPGANPDVEVTAALHEVGCDRVARPVGWLPGTWTAPDGSTAEGHLAVAAEYLAGSQDAWREAVAAVEADRDFSTSARELGQATAQVHLALARAFGTVPVTETERQQIVAGLRSRVEWAVSSAEALEPYAEALTRHAADLDRLADLPDLQRVHGDYHLGQVLHSPERGWIVLDFEGEPLRPLAERTGPDLTLRDVAGMLRSFDYAAAYAGSGGAQPWADAARTAFCDGYAAAGAPDPRKRLDLLDALELDKALYEVVYETRNRPDWVDVPLSAVTTLLASDPS
jgi:trehalose synthase-fused probable maltokinase